MLKLDMVSENIVEGDMVGYTSGEGVLIGSRMARSLGLLPVTGSP
nr:hypothetical protein [Marinicella sp. W31]MDC2877550.1 hypothetical protein [Marinicella sp. W31]